MTHNAPLESIVKSHVIDTLQRLGWNMSKTAAALDIDRRTLYRMLERWGVEPAKERARAAEVSL